MSAEDAAKKIEANVMGLGNKQSALLARIKAAQQKTKPAPSPDQAPNEKKSVDTSIYDPMYQQKQEAAAAAAAVQSAPTPTPVATTVSDFPPAPTSAPAPAPNAADALEDLLGLGMNLNADSNAQDSDGFTQTVAPTQEHVEETFEEILGLEGLSEEDRQALLEEQARILAAIEQEHKNKTPQERRADAFEQRSLSRAVQQPAVGVAVHDDLEAAQLVADEELARELQREEYKRAERRGNSQTNAPAPAPSAEAGSTWMEWLGLGPPPGTGPSGPPPSFAQRPLARGEIGVSLPAGSRPVQTETVSFSGGNSNREQDRLMSSSGSPASSRGSPQRGVVAAQKPLFACVAESVSQAANVASEYATQAMYGDMEVDRSSLLNQQDDDNGGGYSQMGGNK